MSEEYMLSTIDNPWNPFNNFDEWLEFDLSHNYNTLGYVARIANVDSDMDDETYRQTVNKAINDILKFNPLPIYIRVTKDTKVKTNSKAIDDILK